MRKLVHFILKIFMHFYIGKNIVGEDNTPKKGPAIIVANHNSHLDATILLSLFACKDIKNVNIVGAADYFFRNRVVAWLSRNMLGIIPLNRINISTKIFSELYDALDNNRIVIMFPEGSRGVPGEMGSIKKGIAKISENYKTVPIFPIKLHRTGDVLPKGRIIPLPFIINIEVKKEIFYTTSEELLENIRQALS